MPGPAPPFEEIYARVDGGTARSLQAFRRDHPLRQLQVAGTTWDYVATGQGEEAVLFLHGMAGAYDIWWQQIGALRDRYRVLSVTYPAVKDLDGLRRGIAAILAQEGIAVVNVVGSSLGGYLAQYLAAVQPDPIRRAVFANTFPPNDLIARRNRLAGWLLPMLPKSLVARSLRQTVEKTILPAADYSDLVRAYLMEQSYGGMSKAQFLARYRCVVEAFTRPDPLALGIPVLIIESDNDPLVEEALREMLKATYPSATVHTLHQAGHFPYLSKPDAYAKSSQAFWPARSNRRQGCCIVP